MTRSIEKNKEKFKLANIPIWQQKETKGNSLTVLVLDDEGINLNNEILVDGFHRGEGHASFSAGVVHEIAPKDTRIYIGNFFGKHANKNEIIDFIKEYKKELDLINISYNSSKYNYYDEINKLGIPIICSTGNTHRNKISCPANLNYTIAVGAYENKGKAYYSNYGNGIDCLGQTGIFVSNGHAHSGTSCAAPYVTGLLCWLFRYTNEEITVENIRKKIKENCIDVEEKGYDLKSGNGLLILPKEVLNVNQQDFINSILAGAKDGYRQYKILPSLTIAQAILESAWGVSHIENNLFGMKTNASWTGKIAYRNTKEWNGSRYVTVQAAFRAYNNFNESVVDHNELLGTLGRYTKVRQATNYKDACVEVWKAGYATDPKYPEKLIRIIEQNGLKKYDKEVFKVNEHWAEKHWKSLNEKGIIIHEKRFDDNITRGEIFVLLDRLINLFN